MTVHLYACACGTTACLRSGEVLECCLAVLAAARAARRDAEVYDDPANLEPQGPGRRRDKRPPEPYVVVVTARVHMAPGTDPDAAATWLWELFVEPDRPAAWPEGVGSIDWSFEVERPEEGGPDGVE
jgi:hypothetical protein